MEKDVKLKIVKKNKSTEIRIQSEFLKGASYPDGYEDKEICKECKGECCKQYSGCTYPEDFDIDNLYEDLAEKFKSGKWAIDWYENFDDEHPDGYFVRPAHVGVKKLFDPSWGGVCVFLTPTGCSLPFEKRPTGCRWMKPRRDHECFSEKGGKRDAAKAWKPYWDVLLEAAKVGEKVKAYSFER